MGINCFAIANYYPLDHTVTLSGVEG